MKIAIITSTFPPYRGGMGNAAYFQARELARQGEDVTVFCPKVGKERLEGENFKIEYLLPLVKWGNAAFVPQIAGELDKFDIVHLHYPFFGGAEAVWLHFWQKGKKAQEQKGKFIVTYHMDTVGKGWLGLFFKIYKKIILPKIISAAEKILISTQDYARNGDLADYIEQDPEKFIVSNLGVDADKFSPGPKPESLVKKFNIGPDDFVLVFVGGLDSAHYFKGVDYLLQAAAMIGNPDLKLVMVGDGDLKKQYQELAERLGIEKKVYFIGSVSNEDLPDYYRLGDLFVFPSTDRSEAYGLVALEAAACGLPAVASNLPGVRFVVKDGETGLLAEPKNAEDLSEKIKFLIQNPDKLKELGRRARERTAAEFTWPAIVEKIRQVYRSL